MTKYVFILSKFKFKKKKKNLKKMQKFLPFICVSSLIICCMGNYSTDVLFGKAALSPQIIDELFDTYLMEYGSEFVSNFQMANLNLEERKLIFIENLHKIILHNSNPSKTYKKGIYLISLFFLFLIFFNRNQQIYRAHHFRKKQLYSQSPTKL